MFTYNNSKNKKKIISLPFLYYFLVAGIVLFLSSCVPDILPPGGGGSGGGGGSSSPLPARTILDTAYGTDAKQKMDIYLPAGRNSHTKVVFMIHGGAWAGGDKNEFTYYKNLIQAKWPNAAYVNINYRLASNASNIHHTEMMNDITAAVNFIVNNKNAFSVADTLAMVGESAGGQLAMLYTYAFNSSNKVKCVASIYGPSQISDWSWYNTYNIFLGNSISNILTQYAGTPWTTATTSLYESLSPINRVTAQSKPTILFHGNIDVVVPVYQSQWMKNKLNSLGVPNEYYEYNLDGHGFNATNAYDCANKIALFFEKYAK